MVQTDLDYAYMGTEYFRNDTLFEMRLCTKEDFGTDEYSAKLFYSWSGWIILCPESINKDGKRPTLNGYRGSNQTSYLQLRAETCKGADNCADEDEITEKTRDIQVNTWVLHEEIDFSKYGERPTKKR